LLTKDFSSFGTKLFIGGIPAKILKTNVTRIMESIHPELREELDEYFAQHLDVNTVDVTTLKYYENIE
jgi:hypothetical protein